MIITFVVPAYNVADTIERTIDSILNQTDDRYKVIIVNDGSQDQTEAICKVYEENYPDKIRYVYQENRGLGGARNRGLSMVETEYVTFLDSDDWLMPEFVENVLTCLNKETAEIVMTLPVIFHEGSKALGEWYDKRIFEQIFKEDGMIINPQKNTEIYRFEVSQCRKIVSVDYIKRINFRFREQIKWEDVFPHFYLLSQCTKCMGIGSVGFYYRIGSGHQITNMRGRERLDILVVFDDLLKYVGQTERKDLEFPVMRVMVRFAVWCIRMADIENRKLIVDKLHQFFKCIPKSFYRSLKKGSRTEFSVKDALQYRLFLTAIRYRIFNVFFFDYLYQDIAEKVIKKVLRAGQRVA